MKSIQQTGLSKQLLKDAPEASYSHIIKIPLANATSVVSGAATKKLFALKDINGLSLVENRMPVRLLWNETNVDETNNVPLILSSLYKKEIYRIDLSQRTNKYTGETEKNLDEIFKTAQQKDWILFFDEADTLFGKRTEVKDAHDKYANQEVSYLLQQSEKYAGILIIKCVSPECLQLVARYNFKTLD